MRALLAQVSEKGFAGQATDLTALAGLFLALLAWKALSAIGQILRALLSQGGFVGGWLWDRFSDAISGAQSLLNDYIHSAAAPAAAHITAVSSRLAVLHQHTAVTAQQTYAALVRIVAVTIPTQVAVARAEAAQDFARVWAHADDLYNQAVGYAAGVGAFAVARAESLFTVAEQRQDQLYSASIGYAAATEQAAVGYAQQAIGVAEAQTQAAYDAATQHADSLYQQAVAYTGTAVAASEAAIAGSIGQVVAGVNADVQQLGRVITGDLAPAIAGVAAGTIAITKAFDDYMTRCGNSLCRNGGPLSNMLGELGGLIDDGLIFALMIAAAHDPKGTGEVIGEVVGGVAHDVSSLVERVTGIRAA